MTRFRPAANAARTLKALVGCGAMLLLAIGSGCMNSQAPAATPDPFAGLADRSDQAFRQGLEAYGQGQYREALTAFEQARTLSPAGEPRIEQMIARTKAAMAPTPTLVPPTATAVPVPPSPTPVVMSADKPDSDLGQRYFGSVSLAMVPGKDADAPAMTQFFFQDQIGLHIEGLKQHLRLPFALRIFNTDTKELVASVSADDLSLTATPVAAQAPRPASPASTASGSPTLARFWDTYVWYHQGGEQPGNYRLELYANGILTHTIDYAVGTVPVPTPDLAPTEQPQPETLAPPTPEEVPPPPAPAPMPAARPAAQPAPVRPAPTQPPAPTVAPSPTPMPTPATASGTLIGGLPAGLDVNANNGRVFIADGSGVIWANDPSQPTAFNRPVNLDRLPVDLAVDSATGYVFVSARHEASVIVLDATGRRLSTIQMPSAPGDLQVDSALGLVYVALPADQSIGVIDGRGGRLLRTIGNLPQVTSLALDPLRHTLYATHLAGQLSVIDVPTSQVTARLTLSSAGLESVATSRGLAYAINTATHELAVVEPIGQTVSHFVLPAEPAAVAASEDSGSVYVLASRPNSVLRLDPTSGTIVGQVTLQDRGGRFGMSVTNPSDFQGLRSRMVLNPSDQTLYVTLPESGSLSIVPDELFPALQQDIPWLEAPEAPVVASIPGVLRPGAAALPDQPAPARALALSENSEEAN
jgi:hypothetical protein